MALLLVLLSGVLFSPVFAAESAKDAVRQTAFPAVDRPDGVCLTWSDDPRTTQTIQWRTACSVPDGWVQYKESGQDTVSEVQAACSVVEDPGVANDPKNNRFSVVVKKLKPATTYAYRAGSKAQDRWTDWAEFTTAQGKTVPFSFVYMGDPQVGMDTWGRMLDASLARQPGIAFYLTAGDTVNRGNARELWDEFFHFGQNVLSRRVINPVPGNHDYDRTDNPWMFLRMFALPENGPKKTKPESSYSFRYGNALFLMLDSNEEVGKEAAWIKEQLSRTNAVWKFAIYHHPAYSSRGTRVNEEVRQYYRPLFDKYHLDMALQGHDHAYLRTYPMFDGKRVATPKDGTVYVVSMSGTKHYEQDPHDYTEVGFANVSTYQVIDIATNPDKLTYRAYDIDGNVKDELVIEK